MQLSNTATGFLVMLVPLAIGCFGLWRAYRLGAKDHTLPREWRDPNWAKGGTRTWKAR